MDSDFNDFTGPNDTLKQFTIPADALTRGSNLTFAIEDDIWYSFYYNFYHLLSGCGAGNDDIVVQTFSSDLMKAIFLNGPRNVPQTMANLATSMTNNTRQKSGEYVQGHSVSTITYIQVRWLWLVPSSLLLVATLVFLSLTVWQNKRCAMPLWKSSELVTLLHDVRTSSGGGDAQIHSSAEVKGSTKVTQVETQLTRSQFKYLLRTGFGKFHARGSMDSE